MAMRPNGPSSLSRTLLPAVDTALSLCITFNF
jgi:hypothetical protein